MLGKVFISYNRDNDADTCNVIRQILAEHKIDFWYDDFLQSVEDAKTRSHEEIKQCRYLVRICSQYTGSSPSMKKEIVLFHKRMHSKTQQKKNLVLINIIIDSGYLDYTKETSASDNENTWNIDAVALDPDEVREKLLEAFGERDPDTASVQTQAQDIAVSEKQSEVETTSKAEQRPQDKPSPRKRSVKQILQTPAVAETSIETRIAEISIQAPTPEVSIQAPDTLSILPVNEVAEPETAPKPQSIPDKVIERAISFFKSTDTVRQVAEDLRQGGVLDQRLPGYEERPSQILMAQAVATALTTGKHTLIEAGTGTGKSLAYLLPVVRSGKVALVSTANKALQEQLFYKDIPFIVANVQPVKAALVKGFSNYLCLQHYADAQSTLLQEASVTMRTTRSQPLEELNDLINDDENFDGDLDVVPFDLPKNVRSAVAADSDDCAWNSCSFFGSCYIRKMRDKAQNAQIIVVNHTLLLIDTQNENALLPDRDVVIIDEAHHLEDEATRAFTVTVTPRVVEKLLAQKRLRQYCDPAKIEAAINASALAWGRLSEIANLGTRQRAPLIEVFQEGLGLATAMADIGTSLRQSRPETMNESEEKIYDRMTRNASNLSADLRLVFSVADTEGRVYYIEREPGRRGREGMLSVSAAPLNITKMLKEKLFDRISVIATSATLAIDGNFSYFKKRVGILEAEELVLPLAFDYDKNAVLYVPRLQHEPKFGADNGQYLAEIAEQMGALVRASRGRAFLLFTSNRTLQGVYDHLMMPLGAEGYTLLVQSPDIGRAELLRRFRNSNKAVLFGLRSFWEGVDVAGEALSLVAIDKLPFDPPDDPVHEVLVARMKAAGENWFGDYVLPQAILRLKQGVGRLLRTREDRGAMAILDSRLLTKGYGRQVIFALPPAKRTTHIRTVQDFFGTEDESN